MTDVIVSHPPECCSPADHSQTSTAPANSDISCPLSADFHLWRQIHTEVLPLKVQDAYQLVFVREKFMLDVLAARKTTKYEPSKWLPDSETSSHKRTITYSMNFGPKTSNCSETQILSNLNRAGEVYIVTCEVSNEGIPLADSFSIMVHICVRRASAPADFRDLHPSPTGDWCRYTCHANIKYKKVVWGMIKGQLERSAYSGMEGVHRDVASALREHGSPPTPCGHNSRGVVVRRKKRTKTVSSDFSVRARRDDYKRSVEIVWCNVLLNSSFVFLLLGLLIINVFLYARITDLETIAQDYEDQDIQITRESSTKLKDIFTSRYDGVRVARLLEKQDGVFASELGDIKYSLSQASHSLNKADIKIREVLQRLPRTMKVIKDALQ